MRSIFATLARAIGRSLPTPADLRTSWALLVGVCNPRHRGGLRLVQQLLAEGSVPTTTCFDGSTDVAVATEFLATGDVVTRVNLRAVDNAALLRSHADRVAVTLAPMRARLEQVSALAAASRVIVGGLATLAPLVAGGLWRSWLVSLAAAILGAAAGQLLTLVVRVQAQRRLRTVFNGR